MKANWSEGIAAAARHRMGEGRFGRPGFRAGRSALTILAVAVAAGCGDTAEGSGAVAQGRALYQANCADCHGADARGDGPMARALPVEPPNIHEHLGHHTEAELIRLIRGGIPPAMPPTGLSEEEVRHVLAYVWTLVPESEVAELRAMQQQMEMMGEPAPGASPPAMDHSQHMQGSMPGMDHSQHMQDTTPGMDHSQHMQGSMPGMDHSRPEQRTTP
jgi:mono/diheme cytochrome c family protein